MDNTTPFQPWADDENSKNVKLERELVDDAKLHRENVNHPKHGQTASYDKEIVDAPSVVPGPSSGTGSGANPVGGKEPKMDSGQVASMQQIVENTLRYLLIVLILNRCFHIHISLCYPARIQFTLLY